MKRYISITILSIVCFVLQTTLLQHVQLAHIKPNLLVIIVAASGFMYGRKAGMFSGVLCGAMIDLMYSNVIGVSIIIYVVIGFLNGMANKLYYKEDYVIPLLSIAASDLLYGILYFGFYFLLRGRLNLIYYLFHVMLPEAIYTVLAGMILYKFMRWLEGKINPETEVSLSKKQIQ